MRQITGSYVFKYHPDGAGGREIVVDCTPPFKRVSMVAGLEEKLGLKLPGDLDSEETRR